MVTQDPVSSVVESVIDVLLGADDDDDGMAGLTPDARRERWQARRPDISHLKDGLATSEELGTVPLFDVGDRIVIDCCTSLLAWNPGLATHVGKVRSIDDDTGLVSIYDEASDPRHPMVRWASYKAHGELTVFKLAPAKGNPFDLPKVRPQANVGVPVPRPEGKRGRGRPAGAKNRPKDVIKAEKEARRAAKEKAR